MNPDDEPMMLVYEHKTHGRHLVPGGVAMLTEFDTIMIMSANPDIYMVTKAIPASAITIDLYKDDLLRPEEKAAVAEKPMRTTTEDSEPETPWRVFLGHEWLGHGFTELHILTPDLSGLAEPSTVTEDAEKESEKAESEQDAADSAMEGSGREEEGDGDADEEGSDSE